MILVRPPADMAESMLALFCLYCGVQAMGLGWCLALVALYACSSEPAGRAE